MSVTLPRGCPVRLRYIAPQFPVKTFRSVSGASARVLYGNRSSEARLEIEFLSTRAAAADWLAAFEQARGTFDRVLLTSDLLAQDNELEGAIPAYLIWRFAERPSVEKITANRSRIQVSLTGELEA